MSRAASANAEATPPLSSARAAHRGVPTGDAAVGPTWRAGRLLATIALMAVGVFITLDAWRDIAFIAFNDEESSHIFLVPFIVAWLVWNRRDHLKNLQFQTSILGPAVIALGGLMNAYGFYNLTQAAWHCGAVLIVIGCFITVMGWRVVWTLLPAFVVLGFLVPVPGMLRQQISIPLQTITATATKLVYDAFAIPVTQHGSVLHFHGQDIAVAEACNGMRMVFALILVTYAAAFAMPLRNWVRALLLLLSPMFAIACNVIRLIPTVWLLGYYPKTWGPMFHDMSGWGMVIVSFALILGILRVLEWAQIPIMQEEVHSPESGVRSLEASSKRSET